ncbi:MAG: TrmH family RNA methyltransferase [Bacteroidales bacterium]|nr:TrmH family RNA methyltransferase [Bacteroidales bacterium]MCF8332625.1 TrmH family RNA methyltransferase [Bacteroidales bacterium]
MDKRKLTISAYEYFAGGLKNAGMNFKAPYLVGLDLGNPMNHGALIRLGANIGAHKVFFTSDPQKFSMIKIQKTAGSSHTSMPFEFTSFENIIKKVPGDYQWVAIETTKGATSLYETTLPDKCIFIAGNESYGITDEVLQHCDKHVYIPPPGMTKSMNISHAMAVTIFEWYRQQCFTSDNV